MKRFFSRCWMLGSIGIRNVFVVRRSRFDAFATSGLIHSHLSLIIDKSRFNSGEEELFALVLKGRRACAYTYSSTIVMLNCIKSVKEGRIKIYFLSLGDHYAALTLRFRDGEFIVRWGAFWPTSGGSW